MTTTRKIMNCGNPVGFNAAMFPDGILLEKIWYNFQQPLQDILPEEGMAVSPCTRSEFIGNVHGRGMFEVIEYSKGDPIVRLKMLWSDTQDLSQSNEPPHTFTIGVNELRSWNQWVPVKGSG